MYDGTCQASTWRGPTESGLAYYPDGHGLPDPSRVLTVRDGSGRPAFLDAESASYIDIM